MYISYNDALSNLGLSSLTSIGRNLTITDNIALPKAQADALVVQLNDFTGIVTISGNLD